MFIIYLCIIIIRYAAIYYMQYIYIYIYIHTQFGDYTELSRPNQNTRTGSNLVDLPNTTNNNKNNITATTTTTTNNNNNNTNNNTNDNTTNTSRNNNSNSLVAKVCRDVRWTE